MYTRPLYTHIVTLMRALMNTHHQWCCKRNMSVFLCRVRRHSTKTSPAGIRLHWRTLLECLLCVYILYTQCTHGRWMCACAGCVGIQPRPLRLEYGCIDGRFLHVFCTYVSCTHNVYMEDGCTHDHSAHSLMNTHWHHQWCCKRNMSVCLYRVRRHSTKTSPAGIWLHWRTLLKCFMYA